MSEYYTLYVRLLDTKSFRAILGKTRRRLCTTALVCIEIRILVRGIADGISFVVGARQ